MEGIEKPRSLGIALSLDVSLTRSDRSYPDADLLKHSSSHGHPISTGLPSLCLRASAAPGIRGTCVVERGGAPGWQDVRRSLAAGWHSPH